MQELSKQNYNEIIGAMKNEINEFHIYNKLAASTKDPHNKKILTSIANDELSHFETLKKYVPVRIKPSRFKILYFYLIAKFFGLTFGIKLMERGEAQAKINYAELAKSFPDAEQIAKDETQHENQLIELIDEERLKYIGSIVLGLNDALVELTGALAGFTFALQNSKLIATVGLITGISASLAMGVSEYLATKHEEGDKHPIKASFYTTAAYIMVVIVLISPYLILTNVYMSLGITLLLAITIIFKFTYYVSVAKGAPLWSRFFEMSLVSIGVALISFGIGYLVRLFFGVDV
ncbi:MAG: VIT1/CCC1 transporter family protein [Bacteriovoracaceae bacterium]|nr:VIT1/CCC1 transporter family protein [Bacteriovoracaceae bacterium]